MAVFNPSMVGDEMSQGERMPLGLARELTDKLVKVLTPNCDRIMICGSIRREKEMVGDAEVVALVHEHGIKDLFGQRVEVGRTYLDDALDKIDENISLGWKIDNRKKGPKLKLLRHADTGLLCDLYVVMDIRSWGPHIAVRTGPHGFSIELMRRARAMGMFFADGFLLHGHRQKRKDRCPDGVTCPNIIPLRTEADVFEILKIKYMYPQERERKYGIG